MNFIKQHIEAISQLCRKYKVQEMYAFGSVVDEKRFTEKSDVDSIIKFDELIPVEAYADLYFDLADELELLYKRKVDLMTLKPIPNRFLSESIEFSKKIIYAA